MKSRGLCVACYSNEEIRSQYKVAYGGKEPTMEELELMIREQSKDLPKWWFSNKNKEL